MANDEDLSEEEALKMAGLARRSSVVTEEEQAKPFDNEVWPIKSKLQGKVAKPGTVEWLRARAAREGQAIGSLGPMELLPKDVRDRLASVGLAIGVPEAHQAEEWAGRWLRKLLPEAVAVVTEGLRSEDPARRERAALNVLRANGLDKKEAANGGGNSTIIVQMNGAAADTLPWLQRKKDK